MRYFNTNLFWALPAAAAIAVIWMVSALANYYFGASLGTDKPFDALIFETTTSQIFSNASLASDVLKGVMLFAIAASLAQRQIKAALVTGLIWGVCTAWSVASAVGFVSINHANVTDNRGKSAEEWTQLESQIGNLAARRKSVGNARPEGVVQAEIDGLLRAAGDCAVINGPITREVCPKVDKLRIELQNAKSAAWLDGRLDELRAELGGKPRVTSENPFADLASGVLGVVATKITTGQALWFALLLELISGPGLWAICVAVPKSAQKPAQRRKEDLVASAVNEQISALKQVADALQKAADGPNDKMRELWARYEAAKAPRQPLAALEKISGATMPNSQEAPVSWKRLPVDFQKVLDETVEQEVFGGNSNNPPEPPPADSAPIPDHFRDSTKMVEEPVTTVVEGPWEPKPGKRKRDEALHDNAVKRFFSEIYEPCEIERTGKGGWRSGGTPAMTVRKDYEAFCIERKLPILKGSHFGRFAGAHVEVAPSATGKYYGCKKRIAITTARRRAAA